jgi:protease-4
MGNGSGGGLTSFIKVLLMLFLLSVISIVVLIIIFLSKSADLGIKSSFSDNKVALVRVEGVIEDGKKIIKQIEKYAKDDSVKAIIIRIDSPGGVVAPSQDIYEAIKKADAKKPVIASFGAVAASGGYYIAVGAREIFSSAGTLTGSIGVIMSFNNTYKLMEKIGIGSATIKSGKFKDIGSPDREMTEAEKKLLQGLIDDIYDQFLTAVAQGRGLDKEKVRKIADGRIFTGRQALGFNLVDTIGSLNSAVARAAKLGGIKGEPSVVEEHDRLGFLEKLLGDEFGIRLPIGSLSHRAGVYFIWPAAI